MPVDTLHSAHLLSMKGILRQMEGLIGTVVWFNNAKGFGFLSHEGGPDVFVHYTSIQSEGYKSLKEGDKVRFNIIQGDKGPRADQVVILAGDATAASVA